MRRNVTSRKNKNAKTGNPQKLNPTKVKAYTWYLYTSVLLQYRVCKLLLPFYCALLPISNDTKFGQSCNVVLCSCSGHFHPFNVRIYFYIITRCCCLDVDVSSEENTPLGSNNCSRESDTGDIYEPFVDTFSTSLPETTAHLEEDEDDIYDCPDSPLAQPRANWSHLGLQPSVIGKVSAEKQAFNLYSTPTARTKLRSSPDQPGLSSSESNIALQQETEHLYDRPTSSRKLYQSQCLKSLQSKMSFKTDNTYDFPKSSRSVPKSQSSPVFSEAVVPEDGDSLMSKRGEEGHRMRHTHPSESVPGKSQRTSDKRVVRVKHHIPVEL